MTNGNKHVLDTSALACSVFSFNGSEFMTVPVVLKESQKFLNSRVRLRNRGIKAKQPSSKFIHKVRRKAREKNEDLSPTDLEVLALALEEGAEVVTDDYGIQYVARVMGVSYLWVEIPPQKDMDLREG